MNESQTHELGNRFSSSIIRINIQQIFYLLAFLTFGLGDGITGAYMMNALGPETEFNPLLQTLYYLHGWDGVLWVKISGTICLLLAVYLLQQRTKSSSYWTVNGFLAALIIGGLMAIRANLMAISGETSPDPNTVIFIFLAAVLILTEAGDILDKRAAQKLNIPVKIGSKTIQSARNPTLKAPSRVLGVSSSASMEMSQSCLAARLRP